MATPTTVSDTDVDFLIVWAENAGPKKLKSLTVTQTDAGDQAYVQLFAKTTIEEGDVPLWSRPIPASLSLDVDFGEDGRIVYSEDADGTARQGCFIAISLEQNTYATYGAEVFDISAEYNVDALNLSAITGSRITVGNNGDFATLTEAKDAAVSGDTIEVFPGTYEENDLLKNGVNWFLHPGVLITHTMTSAASSVRGIFDDHSGACVCTIDGAGDLFFSTGIYDANPSNNTAGTAAVTGCIAIANAGSSVNIRLNKLTFESFNNATALYFVNGTECHVDIREVLNPNAATGYSRTLNVDEIYWEDTGGPTWPFPSLGIGVFWSLGELYLNLGVLDNFGAYSVWSSEPVGANTANMYYTGDLLNGKIYLQGHSLTYVSWFEIKYHNAMNADISNTFYGGKVYYRTQKTGSTSVGGSNIILDCGAAAGAELEAWINVQKVSGHKKFVRTSGTDHTAKVFIDIMHYEDLSVVAVGIEIGALSDVHIGPGYMKVLNGNGILFSGGTAEIKGLTVNTANTNGATNHPVKVTASGLKLANCMLIAPALADSINATAAFNVGVLACMANKAKHANVTLSPNGVLTVDAALV